MKPILVVLIASLILMSFKADKSGPWIVTSGERIVLYTRPQNFSKSNSPDSLTIQQIIKEQNAAIYYINQYLKTKYNSKVHIFLYNFDEAKAKIGTNGGGFCLKNKIFFTYHENSGNKDTFVYIGTHEMVHRITNKEIGWPKSRLFGEGFANAINGTYGGISIYNWMREYIKNNKIIKPSELLEKTDIPERVFYPQSGFFIKWLFDNYGIDNVKKLYKVGKSNFAKRFKKITGEDFDTMSNKYLEYCNSFKNNSQH